MVLSFQLFYLSMLMFGVAIFFHLKSRMFVDKKVEKLSSFELEIFAQKKYKEYENHQWDLIDYSTIKYTIWDRKIRECYTKKERMLPKDVICFAGEDKLSMVCSRNVYNTYKEAQVVLNIPKPEFEKVIIKDQGEYKIIERKCN